MKQQKPKRLQKTRRPAWQVNASGTKIEALAILMVKAGIRRRCSKCRRRIRDTPTPEGITSEFQDSAGRCWECSDRPPSPAKLTARKRSGQKAGRSGPDPSRKKKRAKSSG